MQARSELAKMLVKESNAMHDNMHQGDVHRPEQQAIMSTALKYCHLTIAAKERVRRMYLQQRM